jgi:hypothetical protein
MLNVQRCDAVLTGVHVNIPVNTRECFRLADFVATIFFFFIIWFVGLLAL